MDDSGAKLGFDVVADQRQPSGAETLGPLRTAGDENRYAVDDRNLCGQRTIHIKLGSLLGADRQEVDQDLCPALEKGIDDLLPGSLGFVARDKAEVRIKAFHMGGNAVQHPAHLDDDSGLWYRSVKYLGTIRQLKNCLADVFANLSAIDIECSSDLDIGGQVAAQIPVHQPQCLPAVLLLVVINTLNQSTGAVAKSGDGYFNRCHQSSPGILIRQFHPMKGLGQRKVRPFGQSATPGSQPAFQVIHLQLPDLSRMADECFELDLERIADIDPVVDLVGAEK